MAIQVTSYTFTLFTDINIAWSPLYQDKKIFKRDVCAVMFDKAINLSCLYFILMFY